MIKETITKTKMGWVFVIILLFHIPNYVVRLLKLLSFSRKKTIFLSGPMEYVKDFGAGWRHDMTVWLKTKGHKAFNPCEENVKFFQEKEGISPEALPSLKNEKQVDLYRKYMHMFFYDDTIHVLYSNFVIVYWGEGIQRGAGTQGEITLAKLFGIPVYMVSDQPVEEIAGWGVGCTNKIFKNFEELKTYLETTKQV